MKSVGQRALGLVLVAVLVMSVATLAATQTFINRTGKTVTGIKIEFSKSVMVTRHDNAFPDKDPRGRSETFTFSGGNLSNLGRFSIFWLPSSAKVTNYEWIEKEQPAQQSQETLANSEQEFKLPDPNTPPIPYGDDYPGPDERLYQPKPDVQIWLTDLDGHGDIYDNDSIKINYAPGFDKSQITKIIVYRNGIRMRFLPEKFDVLTNAQMKTFDGNPAEHSPASNHTDHAIMGYEYKFEIHTAHDLWIQTKTVKSGFKWRPREVLAELGISWFWGQIHDLSDGDIVQFLTYLKQDGFTGIYIGIPYYVMTPSASEILEVYGVNSGISNGYIITPTTSGLEKILKAAKKVGMGVEVVGFLYISQEYQDKHGFTWRSQMEPSNPSEFFENYAKLLLKFVPLFNKYNVDILTPFDEMTPIEGKASLVKEMYTKISNEFNGEMGFIEETANLLNYSREPNGQDYLQLVRKFTLWSWKDSKGRPMRIEYSIGEPIISETRDQAVTPMVHNFIKYLEPAVRYYTTTYPDNPQTFGELDIHNADGQSLGGDAYYKGIPPSQRIMDEQERSDALYAELKGAEKLNIMGFTLWGDFFPGEPLYVVPGFLTIRTGHYDPPESPIYRVFKAIIAAD